MGENHLHCGPVSVSRRRGDVKQLRAWFLRLGGLFCKRRRDLELEEELESHLQMHIEDNLRLGMSPIEARRDALIHLGGLDSTKEAYRDRRGLPVLENVLQDVRYGARMLIRTPIFTIVAILTLALGIGANTAVFSLVNALLIRPLPFRQPDRLVWITNPEISSAGVPGMTRSVNLRDWRELNHSFEKLGCYIAWFDRQQLILTLNSDTIRVEGAWIDKEFLKVLGVSPCLGRDFIDEDGGDAVILTDRFWRRQFQGDPHIIDKPITISGRPWTVVGVLPPAFDFSSIFLPGSRVVDFMRPSPKFGDLSDNSHAVIGRLKTGVTIKQAQLEFDHLNRQLQSAYPKRGKFGARLLPLREHVSGQLRFPSLVLVCAVGCVLLIACVNLSSLLLARASVRAREMAVRMALGAGRRRLLQQMLTESVLLAGCGAAVGLPLAYLATRAMAQSHTFSLPLIQSVRVDGLALGVALIIACSTGLLFGIIPALLLSNSDVRGGWKESGRGVSNGKRRTGIRETLVISEVALACMLLVGACLLIRSFVGLLKVDLGFRPEQVAAWRIKSSRDFATNTQQVAYFQELSRRIEALPGVESVGFTALLPFSLRDVVHASPQGAADRARETCSVFVQGADAGYFKTLRIPLLAGRSFESPDLFHKIGTTAQGVPGVVINDKMARSLWPGKNPVDQVVMIQEDGDPSVPWFEFKVIGVVGDVRQSPLEREAAPQIYFRWEGGGELVVRTKANLASLIPAVHSTIKQFEPGMFQDEFKSLSQMVDQVVSPKRLITLLVGLFSGMALLLASLGIYGVIAYSVSQRTQEIGIRLALGSTRIAVLRLVIRQGIELAAIGGAVGLAASLALTRFLQTLLFGVSPTDPLAFAMSCLLLIAVTLLACWLPARRATRVNPMVALRYE
jgi:predicted permease